MTAYQWTSGVCFSMLVSALTISALIAVLDTPAWAGGAPLGPPPGGPHSDQQGRPPGPRPPRPIGPRLEELERLGLTDVQRDKLADLHDQEMRQVIRLDADARIAERDLERIVLAEHADSLAMRRQASRVASLRGQMLEARVTTLLALRRVLTTAQWSKLRHASRDDGGPAEPREP